MTETMLLLARSRLRRFCAPSMAETAKLMVAMHGVMQQVSPRVARALERSQVAPSCNFALSWLITWCSHDVSDSGDMLRMLFDFLVQTNENMVVFVCIALLVHFFRCGAADAASPGARPSTFMPFGAATAHFITAHDERQQQQQQPVGGDEGASDLADFDERRFGALVDDFEIAPDWVIGDFGMLHTFLKQLPRQLSRADAEPGAALARLRRVLDTASRLERAHKRLLLFLLEDPDARVVVAADSADSSAAASVASQQQHHRLPPAALGSGRGGVAEADGGGGAGGAGGGGASPADSLVSAAVGGGVDPAAALRSGFRFFLVVGFMASAAAARMLLEYQRLGISGGA